MLCRKLPHRPSDFVFPMSMTIDVAHISCFCRTLGAFPVLDVADVHDGTYPQLSADASRPISRRFWFCQVRCPWGEHRWGVEWRRRCGRRQRPCHQGSIWPHLLATLEHRGRGYIGMSRDENSMHENSTTSTLPVVDPILTTRVRAGSYAGYS